MEYEKAAKSIGHQGATFLKIDFLFKTDLKPFGDGTKIANEFELANTLNNYFINIVQNLVINLAIIIKVFIFS